MNLINKILACSLLTGLAGFTVINTQAATISLSANQDGGGKNCTVPADNRLDVWLNQGDYGCTNDEMTYFKLDNVRSAVEIWLKERNCDQTGNWEFKLKTYIDPISTAWVTIEGLRGQPDGTIITRGLRRIGATDEYDGQLKGKLSCLRIFVSEPG